MRIMSIYYYKNILSHLHKSVGSKGLWSITQELKLNVSAYQLLKAHLKSLLLRSNRESNEQLHFSMNHAGS